MLYEIKPLEWGKIGSILYARALGVNYHVREVGPGAWQAYVEILGKMLPAEEGDPRYSAQEAAQNACSRHYYAEIRQYLTPAKGVPHATDR